MKQYIHPNFEIIKIKLTEDILSASQEETIPIHTDDPSQPTDPPLDDLFGN